MAGGGKPEMCAKDGDMSREAYVSAHTVATQCSWLVVNGSHRQGRLRCTTTGKVKLSYEMLCLAASQGRQTSIAAASTARGLSQVP